MKDAHNAESNEKSLFDFIFLVILDCTYNLPKIYQPKEMFLKSGQIHRKDANYSDNDYSVHEFFLCDFYLTRYDRFCTENSVFL